MYTQNSNIMVRLLSLFTLSLFVVACGPSGTEVESSEAKTAANAEPVTASFAVDAMASTVEWEGTKLIGGGHQGTIPVTKGMLETNDGKLVGGSFTLDVAGLQNTDLGEEDGKGKLEGHLKGADFFDVEQFPTASFEITGVTMADNAEDGHTHDITGNLTLKGTSRSITIPATVTTEGDMVKAMTPDFVIDRTEWGVQYGSNSLGDLAKDKVINDEIGLKINLIAKK